MASTWPAKNNYATGDVLTAANMNGVGDDLNDVYNFSGYAAGKNKLINGDFGIWQRGTTFSPTAVGGTIYSADRWANYNNGNGAITVSQQTFAAGTAPVSGYEGTYFHRTTFPASLGTTSVYIVEQRIEDVRQFAGQTVTLSFWAKLGSSQATPFNFLRASQVFGSGGSATVDNAFTAPSLTTSWARYSVTLAIPSIAGKTIGTNSYLSILFALNAQASQTFDLWGVQLEAGSTASIFQTATGTKQGELAACQRYFVKLGKTVPDGTGAANSMIGVGGIFTTTVGVVSIQYPVQMRTTPTMTVSNLRFVVGGSNYTTGTWAADSTVTDSSCAGVTYTHGSAVFTVGQAAYMSAASNPGYVYFNAEL